MIEKDLVQSTTKIGVRHPASLEMQSDFFSPKITTINFVARESPLDAGIVIPIANFGGEKFTSSDKINL